MGEKVLLEPQSAYMEQVCEIDVLTLEVGFELNNQWRCARGGSLEPFFSSIVVTGPGAGMGLMFVIAGLCGGLIGFGDYAFKVGRNVEDIIPDHQAVVTVKQTDISSAEKRDTSGST